MWLWKFGKKERKRKKTRIKPVKKGHLALTGILESKTIDWYKISGPNVFFSSFEYNGDDDKRNENLI